MTPEMRRWVWMLSVALIAAAVWWLYPEDNAPGPAPSIPEPAKARAPAEPQPRPRAAPTGPDPPSDEGEPFAAPLPRDEVVLPKKQGTMDAGVVLDDPASIQEQRDRMLGIVLDRLQEDLRGAQDAGDEERAAQLRVRIDRLEQRRNELTSP